MKLLKQITLASGLAISVSAQAITVDFIDLTQNHYGESAWQPLTEGIMSVDGYKTTVAGDSRIYAYLDWDSHKGTNYMGESNVTRGAGLGACNQLFDGAPVGHPGGDPVNGTNHCDPGSDDNVTTDEFLRFTFSEAVTITSIWVNNNHDGGFGSGDKVNINGLAYDALKADHLVGLLDSTDTLGDSSNDFSVVKGGYFDIAFNNEQFYVSGIEYVVDTTTTRIPEPASLILLGLGLMGLTFARRIAV